MKNKTILAVSFVVTVMTLSACSTAQNESGKITTEEQVQLISKKDQPGTLNKNNTVQNKVSADKSIQPEMEVKLSQSVASIPVMLKRKQELSKQGIIQTRQISPIAAYQDNISYIQYPQEQLNTEKYAHLDQNAIKRVLENPVSTFSIDVDTGSYSNMRRFINSGSLPRRDAVRVEELVNYFNYQYPLPENNTPFGVTTEIAPTPWNKNTYLLHIGIKGLDISKKKLPASNLVFLVDVSGSMQSVNKLGLLKTSLKLLTKQLRSQDKISLVVYAGASGVVLEPTDGNKTATISRALDNLAAGGSTNGAAGIKLAYSVAEQAFIKGGINRIILATDGDFNVGTVNFEALTELVEQKRKSGISLTTLGFGSGNYNDHLMEQLADKGNGNYHYIDTLNEAQKVLVDEMSSTLQTIAKDVKIQIEFNKTKVAEYRLIGYENRILKREDFNNDKVDAGDIGAGHTVTALYEISLVGSKGQSVDELRYQNKSELLLQKNTVNGELAFLKIRYKAPDKDTSELLSWPLKTNMIIKKVSNTSDRFRFSAAVAAFGQKIKGGQYIKNYSYSDILDMARDARGKDYFGYRGEFIKLVNLTKSLS
ncbi:MAG: von Willebrand factor type A domain-containing protein [Thiohalomonadales bacterium]